MRRNPAGPNLTGPSVDHVDVVQELSARGVPRGLICLKLQVDDQTLYRWAEENIEVRDALSVNNEIRRTLALGSKRKTPRTG